MICCCGHDHMTDTGFAWQCFCGCTIFESDGDGIIEWLTLHRGDAYQWKVTV